MKNLVVGVVAAVVGIAGGTAWKVVTHEPAPLAADSAMVETAAEGAGPASSDSVGLTSAGIQESGTDAEYAATSGAPSRPAPGTPAPEATASPAGASVSGSASADGQDQDAGADQLARIFTAMQPRDAARVLSQLTDPEIRDILVRMGARQAASILSSMEPARAADLSRIVLGGQGAMP